MATHRDEELIQRSLDGMLEADEHRALTHILAADNDSLRCHDRLVGVHNTLETARSYDPPADITGAVMARIRHRERQAAFSQEQGLSAFKRFIELLARKPAYSLSLGFALGALALMPLALRLQSTGMDPAAVSGAIGTAESRTTGQLGRLQITGEGFEGKAYTVRYHDRLLLQLDLTSAVPVTVDIDHRGTQDGIANFVTRNNTAAYIQSFEHQVRIDHVGHELYEVTLIPNKDIAPSFEIRVSAGKEVLFSGELGAPDAPNRGSGR